MRKLLVFIGFLAGVASCIYPFDPVIDGEAGDMAVFEANIIVGGVSTVLELVIYRGLQRSGVGRG